MSKIGKENNCVVCFEIFILLVVFAEMCNHHGKSFSMTAKKKFYNSNWEFSIEFFKNESFHFIGAKSRVLIHQHPVEFRCLLFVNKTIPKINNNSQTNSIKVNMKKIKP